MKKCFIVIFFIIFIFPAFVYASGNNNVELVNFKVVSQGPYYEGQRVTATYSIVNNSNKTINLDTITLSGLVNSEEYINFKWNRNVYIEPGDIYTYIGYYTFKESGSYELFPTIKEVGSEWNNNITAQTGVSEIVNLYVESLKNPNFVCSDLPDGVISSKYGPVEIITDDNKKLYSYEIVAGSLPDGLKINEDGCIEGIPIRTGSFNFKVKVKKDNGDYIVKEFDILVGKDRVSLIGYIDSLYTGRSYSLGKLLYSKNNSEKNFEFSVLDSSVAVIEDNRLKTINKGMTILTARDRDNVFKEKSIIINVNDDNEIQKDIFPDVKNHWSKDSINRLYLNGAINGYPNGEFLPDNYIKKSEIAKIIFRALYIKYSKDKIKFNDVDEHWASDYIEQVGKYFIADKTLFNPDNYAKREEIISAIVLALGWGNEVVDPTILDDYFRDSDDIDKKFKKLIAIALDKGMIKGFDDGRFKGKYFVTRAQACKLIENAENIGGYSLLENDLANWINPNEKHIKSPNDSMELRNERLEFIFGMDEKGNYNKYKTKEEADLNMVNVEIDAWDINKNGEKYKKKYVITVNKKIEDEVRNIFKEIYENDEKFPIKNIGGYVWRNVVGSGNISEHSYGTCIDINYEENPYIVNGKLIVGNNWEPYVNPYSIPENGSVVNTFRKYKWGWGGADWESVKDYMHFSYLGH